MLADAVFDPTTHPDPVLLDPWQDLSGVAVEGVAADLGCSPSSLVLTIPSELMDIGSWVQSRLRCRIRVLATEKFPTKQSWYAFDGKTVILSKVVT